MRRRVGSRESSGRRWRGFRRRAASPTSSTPSTCPRHGSRSRPPSKALELDQVVLAEVLEAEQRVRTIELEHLAVLVQQQEQLAEIERLVGGDL